MTEPDVSPGRRLQHAMQNEKPLAVAGTINAYCALLAQKAGFNALYLSGAGVANASFGLPDLGLTTLENVREDTARITAITKLPLIVDADTGFGDPAATAKVLSGADAAAMQIEDQVDTKRCGHRPGKVLVPGGEMRDRIKSALRGKSNPDFMIIARTDAYTVEGLDAAIARAQQYVKAGADIIFAEALTQLDEYKTFCRSVSVPVLANITEFGKTPLYSMDELGGAGVQLVLYPLTAFRAMSAAALKVYQTLRAERSQASLIDSLQTREELYKILNYYEYEKALDDTLSSGKE